MTPTNTGTEVKKPTWRFNNRVSLLVGLLILAFVGSAVVVIFRTSAQHESSLTQRAHARQQGFRYGYEIGKMLSPYSVAPFAADNEPLVELLYVCDHKGSLRNSAPSWDKGCTSGIAAGHAFTENHSMGTGSATIVGVERYCPQPVLPKSYDWHGIVELSRTVSSTGTFAFALVSSKHLSFVLHASPGTYELLLNGSNTAPVVVHLASNTTTHAIVGASLCAL